MTNKNQPWRTARAGTGSLDSEILEHLRASIQSGRLSPGDRLPPEREHAKELNVARLTLRKALKELQREGYLESRVGSRGGTFVTELTLAVSTWRERMQADIGQLEDILEYRIAVETHTARLAAERHTDEDVQAMQDANRDLGAAESRNAFRQADAAFHHALALASHSPRLIELEPVIRGELFSPIDHLDFDPPRRGAEVDHARIIREIVAGRGDAAARAAHRHLDHTRDELYALLRADKE